MKRILIFIGLVMATVSSPGQPAPACQKWMTRSQCDQVLALLPIAMNIRTTPLDNEPGEPCVGDPSLNMCSRSINKSFTNWHQCGGNPKLIRCDIHYCEYDPCFDTSCTIVDAYCCVVEDDQHNADWSTAEVGACEF